MNRRQFLTLPLALPLCQPSRTPPNIIVILCDDIGWDFSSVGQRHYSTPHIDRLASEGLLFSQYHAAAPVCHPSRWALLTGKQPRSTNNPEAVLEAGDITLPELLTGYRTGLIGKWGVGGRRPWEVFGYSFGPQYTPFYAPSIFENGVEIQIPENLSGRQGSYTPDLLQAKALEFVRTTAGPWFLLYTPYLGHIAGNGGYPVPGSDNDFIGTIARLDGYIGEIRAAVPPDTVILLTSDNGPHLDSTAQYDRTGGRRGGKKTVYQGGLNVPLIAWGPGIARGESSRVCGGYDLFATVLELAGMYPPMFTESLSIFSKAQHHHLYFAFSEAGVTSEAVRWGPWKAVRIGGGPVELYDLAGDPGEAVDVAASEPGVAGYLGELMDGYCVAGCQVWLPVVGK